MNSKLTFTYVVAALLIGHHAAAADIAPIKRILPPEGIEIPAEVKTRLESRLAAIRAQLTANKGPGLLQDNQTHPDIDVFLKAVDYALRHGEFYVPKDFEKADWALDQAEKRIAALQQQDVSLDRTTGLLARGYRSSIDQSPQPYGLVIPENHDFTKPCPLYVWLHGRGDKNTDLHFLYERSRSKGQIAPPGAIVVHPFGRHCVGYKSAGEDDVHDAVVSVMRRYKIDDRRIVLIGFSMGGAGAWQVGAHSAANWVAISPGAGFVDVARYQRLNVAEIPEYEKKLWGVNDVPNYVRNLFNTNVIAYSGELDKQREAAVIMEEAYKTEGRTLTHLIGPGVEHKYEPATLADLMKRLDAVVAKGREAYPGEVHFQTRSLRYARQAWITVDELEEHWQDSRIDAKQANDKFDIQTKNIARFDVTLFPTSERSRDVKGFEFKIDGQPLTPRPGGEGIYAARFAMFAKRDGKWQWHSTNQSLSATGNLHKSRLIQGPIDDAFVDPFVVVTPTGRSKNAQFQAWVDFEIAHLRDRWRALMRGELPEVKDTDFEGRYGSSQINVILFGDPDSNSVMTQLLKDTPTKFTSGKWSLGDQTYDGDRYIPTFTYPRRFGDTQSGYSFKYVVFNSGLTFREAHDRTNSQQNPKLPDWAIIDITQPPNNLTPGRIHDADFFNEEWKLKRQPLAP